VGRRKKEGVHTLPSLMFLPESGAEISAGHNEKKGVRRASPPDKRHGMGDLRRERERGKERKSALSSLFSLPPALLKGSGMHQKKRRRGKERKDSILHFHLLSRGKREEEELGDGRERGEGGGSKVKKRELYPLFIFTLLPSTDLVEEED